MKDEWLEKTVIDARHWMQVSPHICFANIDMVELLPRLQELRRLREERQSNARTISTHSMEKYPLGEAADDTGDA